MLGLSVIRERAAHGDIDRGAIVAVVGRIRADGRRGGPPGAVTRRVHGVTGRVRGPAFFGTI